MGLNFKTIFTGLKIKAKAILTSDTKGELEVSDSTGKLNYHDGLTRSPVVTESHTATITNKTIDADNNTVSNLEVDNLKAGVLNTSTNLAGASDTQVPSALAVKTYIDDGLAHQNEASEITYDNSVSGLAATNAQDAIDEVEARVDTAESDITAVENALQAHITNPSDAHDASAISNDPSGNLAATTVQAALNELQTDLDTRATQSDLANHINQVTDAHDASAISVSPTVDLVSTTVQAALEELQAEVIAASGSASGVQANLDAHINDTLDAHDASAISVVPTGNLAATEVQAALVELQSDIDTRATSASLSAHTSASTGVHGVTGSVVGTSDTQTLTNKTIDADLNTITNIENADIKAGANIARNKLASGTANSIIVNDGTGVLSEMANASNSANAITLTNLKHIELQSQDDATTTGSNATLATFTAGGVRITNGSLVSLANIPAGNNGQQFVLFNRTGVSVSIKDASAAIGSAAARILTGTGADITLASNAALILSYDSVSQRWQVVGGSGGGSGTATSAIDNVFTINDATDPTKQINFDAGGTTSTKTTIAASQTANRVLSLPDVTDTLVSRTSTDTLTNKTIVAANNTITTAASGNLTSTELNAALSELQQHIDAIDPNANELLTQNFEIAVLADFTQTGLELVSSPFIHGTKTARLIHQAASTRSFKQTKSVDPKFRGKNLTLRLDGRSSAASANVTVLITDETNATTLVSSTFTTGQITAAVFNTTNASATVTVTDNSILNSVSIGASITGSGIPTGTTVTAKGTSTITLSQNATATATGVSLKVSALPNIQSYSFNIPSNCSSLSYTVSALQEAGSPETYIDDVVIELTEMALSSASVTVPKNNDTNFQSAGNIIITATTTNPTKGTVVRDVVWASRNGQRLLAEYQFTQSTGGSAGSGDYLFSLPNGLSFDSNVVGFYTGAGVNDPNIAKSIVGYSLPQDSSVVVTTGVIVAYNSTKFRVLSMWGGSSKGFVSSTFFNLGIAIGYSLRLDAPIQGWSANETESKTIPLTSSVLVTESDSSIRVGTANGYGSSGTRIRRFLNILESIGSSVRYVSDAVNGDYFEILEDGEYDISYSDQFSSAGGEDFAITKNATNLNTSYTNTPENLVICNSSTYGTNYRGTCSAQVYLVKGDKLRAHTANASSVGSTPNNCKFTISKVGSTKILNPSSDQKVEIPTHELLMTGASTRGSVNTVITKFDSLSKIKGDGFEILNTTANGTVVTFKKNLKVEVDATLALPANSYFGISLNDVYQAIQESGDSSTAYCNAKCSFIAKPGDILKIPASANPLSDSNNRLNIVATEQSVAVALQNVAPRWDDSDSAVRLKTGNGFGSTNANVRRYSGLLDNIGSDITYADSPALGGSFTINTSGVYNITATEQSSTATTLDLILTKNQTAAVDSNNILALSNVTNTTGFIGTVTASGVYLQKGDVIRLLVNPPTSVNSTSSFASFTISKVGKTQGTVDVTPFVNVRTHENIVGEVVAFAGSTIPENFLLCDGRSVSRTTYADLFNVIGTAHGSIDSASFNLPDYRGRFLRGVDGTAGNDPDKASRTAMNTGGNTGNNVGSVQADQFGSHNHGGGNHSHVVSSANAGGSGTQEGPVNAGGTLNDSFSIQSSGTIISTQGGNETRPKNAYVNYIIRFAKDQMGIATPTEQVSSDTINFVFKPTAIVDSDPVGTFNTYKKAPNSQAATTLCTTAPTQSISSMNINGVLVTAANYATAGTDALPNRFDIKIGKGLKGWNVLGYNNTGRLTEIMLDLLPYNTAELYGITKTYNETTGILTIDAGFNNNTTITNRGYLLKVGAVGAGTAGYFTFNASKSPSLVSIPNLQQRVAYISDVKASGTDGGSSVAGQQTRTLNTLADNTGIVTSLASNQFTLPAGTYKIRASVPAYASDRHQAKLRNVTDTIDVLIGSSEYTSVSSSSTTKSIIEGQFTINSSKTFSILHYTQIAATSLGLGIAVGAGNIETYTQVEITKIK